MQVKIIIGTVAFMLTMIIFGYAALREPARMETTTLAFEGRTIEKGAALYYSNCTSCHGVNGMAQECYGPEGEQIACQGLPLNHAPLLCGQPSERMEARGWNGSKEAFITATLNVGRAGGIMVAWGAEYGGPFEPYQIDQLTQFLLNWENEELCSGPTPTPQDWPETVAGLPAGDAANGEGLYSLNYGCSACHGNPAETAATAAVGPWAGEFANLGDVRIEGYTAASYVYESILLPSAYIAPECPTGPCAGPPSSMPANFGQTMSVQDMADMMAYLLGTETFEGDTVVEFP